MVETSVKPALEPIYYTDEYPREGCTITIKVGDERCSMQVSAPGGKVIDCYAPPRSDVASMLALWMEGKVPGVRAIRALARMSPGKSG